MGATLMRSAHSPNITERLDHSCAVFDADARLVAQAAHIPVHLGSMPRAVEVARELGPFYAGDAVLLNDPFAGGTHLPDLTLVTPVFLHEKEGASGPRAHAHAAHASSAGNRRVGRELLLRGRGARPACPTTSSPAVRIMRTSAARRRGRCRSRARSTKKASGFRRSSCGVRASCRTRCSRCCSRTCARPTSAAPISRRRWARRTPASAGCANSPCARAREPSSPPRARCSTRRRSARAPASRACRAARGRSPTRSTTTGCRPRPCASPSRSRSTGAAPRSISRTPRARPRARSTPCSRSRRPPRSTRCAACSATTSRSTTACCARCA
ncbi:MAG: hydantoinase B/oxoprolinase family protein [Candidatus Eisenbacteria bacterium]|nr:hydantoinase B/oxoprolinase family protein [Candidatus Eisenbacteria bacterium]